MRRCALSTFVLFLACAGGASAQQGIPFVPPKPLGGPIVGPDGKVLSGLDREVSPWSGGAELGISGSDGNSRVLKIRAGLDLKYDSPEDVFTFNGFYGLSQQDDVLNENKALLTARNEIPFDEVWAWFSQAQLEYDDFRVVDLRLALHSGVSYTAIKDEKSLLKLRAGIGAAREIGGVNQRWLPEAQFGFDYEYKLSDRSKLIAAADYYPDLKNFSHYRIRGRISFDTLIDPEHGILLRIGAQERYDSVPGGGIRRNDLDYYITLLMRF